jgi:hypothetical protein
MRKPLVIIESPYAGHVEENLRYLRRCLRDSILRGEAPFASHGLYTQPGVLDDTVPAERELGITSGYAWWRSADRIAFYVDRGMSSGMWRAIELAVGEGRAFDIRALDETTESKRIAEGVRAYVDINGSDWRARKRGLNNEGDPIGGGDNLPNSGGDAEACGS